VSLMPKIKGQPRIKAIMAISSFGEFSNNEGSMPWGNRPPSAADGKHFAAYTKDCVVVMGSETWKSLPFYLKGRVNVVLSTKPDLVAAHADGIYPDEIINTKFENMFNLLKKRYPDKTICVIGGLGIIQRVMLAHIDELSITTVHNDFGTGRDIDLSQLAGLMKRSKLQWIDASPLPQQPLEPFCDLIIAQRGEFHRCL
jgi:dihydrofolate reductase